MDGVRCSNRTVTELESFRLVSYDHHQQRMLACSGATQLHTLERVGGDELWEPSGTWDVPCQGEITEVTWAPSHFGQAIAVASSNGKVFIYVQQPKNNRVPAGAPGAPEGSWSLSFEAKCGVGPVRGLQFGPRHLGLCLAVGCTDGKVRIYASPDVLDPSEWAFENEIAVGAPVTCLTWRHMAQEQQDMAPALLIGSEAGAGLWVYNAPLNTWQPTGTPATHPDVRPGPLTGPAGLLRGPAGALAWAPTLGRPTELFAASFGTQVHIFSCQGAVNDLQLSHVAVLEHAEAVWKVEWNLLGNWFAAATEDGKVHLWRPDLDGQWQRQNIIEPER